MKQGVVELKQELYQPYGTRHSLTRQSSLTVISSQNENPSFAASFFGMMSINRRKPHH